VIPTGVVRFFSMHEVVSLHHHMCTTDTHNAAVARVVVAVLRVSGAHICMPRRLEFLRHMQGSTH
jgi:hypothetical protein